MGEGEKVQRMNIHLCKFVCYRNIVKLHCIRKLSNGVGGVEMAKVGR